MSDYLTMEWKEEEEQNTETQVGADSSRRCLRLTEDGYYFCMRRCTIAPRPQTESAKTQLALLGLWPRREAPPSRRFITAVLWMLSGFISARPLD